MGKFILKLPTPDGPRYLEYSTIVDAPTTHGMTLDEFTDYFRAEYGEDGMRELPARLVRVENTGTSEHDSSLDTALLCNCAGEDETHLTLEQIVDWYCVAQGEGTKPRGTE